MNKQTDHRRTVRKVWLKVVVGLGMLGILIAFPEAGRLTEQIIDKGISLASQVTPAQPQEPKDESFFSKIFSGDGSAEQSQTLAERVGTVSVRLLLAALFGATLAFRPRRQLSLVQRNPYVTQTEILLAVVASALMMIVADSAARAFGIFAAASLVRFRTNIRDPKETTVLLASLAIGLATGVGRWELAFVFSMFTLVLLSILEFYEPAQVVRSMELKVGTRNVETTDESLKEIFDKHHLTAEIRELNKEDEKGPGKIVYYVSLSPVASIDQLSEEIFSSDPDSIDSIEWDQKRSTSYIYR